MQFPRLENMAVPDRNWRQRLSRTITVEDAKCPRNQGRREKEGCWETRSSSRESVQLAMDLEGGEELAANH